MPSCREIAAISATSGTAPVRAASPENFAMSRGPDMDFMLACPRKSRPSIESVMRKSVSTRRQPSTTACLDREALEHLGQIRADLDADAPGVAFLLRRDRRRGGLAAALVRDRERARRVLLDGGDEPVLHLGRAAPDVVAGDREDDVARLQPGGLGRAAGDDHADAAAQVLADLRVHARVADVVLAASVSA